MQIGGSGDHEGFDVAYDRFSNVYIVGQFTGTATFPSASGATLIATGRGQQTAFLAKYTRAGERQWVRTGSPAFGLRQGKRVAVDPTSGSVCFTGFTQGNAAFSASDGAEHVIRGPGTWYLFLVKYDPKGNFRWGYGSAASPNCQGLSIAADFEGNSYVTGWLEGRTTFSGRGGNLSITGLSGPVQRWPDYPGDAFVISYDPTGRIRWANQIGGYKASGFRIATSPAGELTAVGVIGNIAGTPAQRETTATSQPGGANISLGSGQLTAPYNRDLFYATYARDGVLRDAGRIGGSQQDGGGGVAYDADSNLYLAGTYQGALDVDGDALLGRGRDNLFVPKHGRAGVDWVIDARGADDSDSWVYQPAIALAPNARVWITGITRRRAVFGSVQRSDFGAQDVFSSKLRLD